MTTDRTPASDKRAKLIKLAQELGMPARVANKKSNTELSRFTFYAGKRAEAKGVAEKRAEILVRSYDFNRRLQLKSHGISNSNANLPEGVVTGVAANNTPRVSKSRLMANKMPEETAKGAALNAMTRELTYKDGTTRKTKEGVSIDWDGYVSPKSLIGTTDKRIKNPSRRPHRVDNYPMRYSAEERVIMAQDKQLLRYRRAEGEESKVMNTARPAVGVFETPARILSADNCESFVRGLTLCSGEPDVRQAIHNLRMVFPDDTKFFEKIKNAANQQMNEAIRSGRKATKEIKLTHYLLEMF